MIAVKLVSTFQIGRKFPKAKPAYKHDKGLPSDSDSEVQTLQIQQCTWPRNGVRMEKPSFLKKANTDKACTFV